MSKNSTFLSVDPKLTDAETSMKQTIQSDHFGQLLLSHVDMCYSVALALTRNPYDARELSREVLIKAWYLRGNVRAQTSIKMKLLTALREEFLQHYRGDLRHIIRETEWNTERASLEVQGAS